MGGRRGYWYAIQRLVRFDFPRVALFIVGTPIAPKVDSAKKDMNFKGFFLMNQKSKVNYFGASLLGSKAGIGVVKPASGSKKND